MKPNIQPWDRVARVLFGVIVAYAAYTLFENPVARVLAALGALFTLAEGITGVCYLQRHLGIRSIAEGMRKDPILILLTVQLVFAYEWWSSGWEKVTNPLFADGLPKTFAAFASNNPFPWVKNFLTTIATPNAATFALLVTWGALAAGIALFAAAALYAYSKNAKMKRWMVALSLAALIGGMLLNATYFFSAGWTGPGTKGMNVVMFWIQAMLVYAYGSWLAEERR
ncbi:hypothetical protein A3E39_01690 [Candidatus Uhrbacteria bacterium RIFCSPHIGHO2_12_FULL_60_25]|uniref:Inner membrane protein YgaP-like transmembrane domain-containing protein n=1 Tax=Candidatus Uhrbacteria bacterium RIFCSPHIGHO2_12_FULL_60_25 TaxID=1802399 RepID=A0A1F7ULN8_9BACT|nr:MAG: hypothetical protein A3D73_01860 [Candidatus Uhrbacteria bacterium RIFCSPHIGHO2_02_FULL_60_44]OGL78628.1 MAG: hypothetical protein A3E39_01690 [Candidatus Uhrbacteria bacterium RIFCSPHIGHO2_12_FULL_60_25]